MADSVAGTCAEHPGVPATFTCARCGDFGCGACEHRVVAAAKPLCSACWSARERTVVAMETRHKAWLPKVALGLGIAALIPCLWPLQVSGVLVGSVVAYRSRSDPRGRTLALVGVALSVVGLIGSTALFFLWSR